jgi:hypothetical protein
MQPTFLEAKPLSSINFWMNSAEARSSTHYDAVFMKVGEYTYFLIKALLVAHSFFWLF